MVVKSKRSVSNSFFFKVAGLYHLDLDAGNYYRLSGHPYNIGYNRELGAFFIDLYFNLKVPAKFFFELFFSPLNYRFSYEKFRFNDVFLLGNSFNVFRGFYDLYFDKKLDGMNYFVSQYNEFFSVGVYDLSDVCLSKYSFVNLFNRVVKPNLFTVDTFISLFQKFLRRDVLFKEDVLLVVYDKVRSFSVLSRGRDTTDFYLPLLYDQYRFWEGVNDNYFLGLFGRVVDFSRLSVFNDFVYEGLVRSLDCFFVNNLVLLNFWSYYRLFVLCDFRIEMFDFFLLFRYFMLVFFYFNLLVQVRGSMFFDNVLGFNSLKFIFFLFSSCFFSRNALLFGSFLKSGISPYSFLVDKYAPRVRGEVQRIFFTHKIFRLPSSIVTEVNNSFWCATYLLYHTRFGNYADVYYTDRGLSVYMRFLRRFVNFVKFFFLRDLSFKSLFNLVSDLNMFQVVFFFRLLVLYFSFSVKFKFFRFSPIKFRRRRKSFVKVVERFKRKQDFLQCAYNFFTLMSNYQYYSKYFQNICDLSECFIKIGL